MPTKAIAWNTYVITTNSDTERFRQFQRNNSHLDFDIFKGIDGRKLSGIEIIESGLATESLLNTGVMSAGTIGCAASHRLLRSLVARSRQSALILEDDSISHPGINEFINQNIETIEKMDILFLGINTDSILASMSAEGLYVIKIFKPKHPDCHWISKTLQRTHLSEVRAHRLLHSFGNHCYFITPHGASKLEALCFPLSTKSIAVPLIRRPMMAAGMDRSQNGIFKAVNAFVCQPFLAYSTNLESLTKQRKDIGGHFDPEEAT